MVFHYINELITNLFLNVLTVAFPPLLSEVLVFGFLTFPRPYWERVKYSVPLSAQNCKMNGNTECCIIDIRIQKDHLTSLIIQLISVKDFDTSLSLLLNEVGKDPSALKINNVL